MSPSTTSPATPAKSGKAWLWVGLATMVLGIALAGVSTFRMVDAIAIGNAFSSPVIEAPVTVVEYYEPQQYFVYQAADGSERVTAAQVVVRGADGELPVTTPRYEATIDDGDVVMEAVAAFTVTRAGEYAVSVEPDEPTSVRISPALGAGIGSAMAWGAGIGLGILLSLVGLTLAVVGAVRGMSRPAQVSAVLPPPGWYPDPSAAASQRYWNGAAWTEHVT